ncbi:MAG: double-strand break repair protein AddB, partial [Alphaproteobacteria bacterium]|nr:double-strand break repair protein AddB [Alphaproteobacteria bacterium]
MGRRERAADGWPRLDPLAGAHVTGQRGTGTLYTLPASTPFLPALAAGLWDKAERDPIALSAMRIYLPTRRACRLLRDTFIPVTGLKAVLLPQMQPLGDIGEESDDGASVLADPILAARLSAIPPAISPMRRRLLLAQQVMRRDPTLGSDQAYGLAGALATLMDEVQIAGRDSSAMRTLINDDDLARHWQETLAFLNIVTDHWPAILQAEGCIDPADRRNRVIAELVAFWREKPPTTPIIAAGSTASVPATAALLQAIANLPQGSVILPGLDLMMDDAAWDAIDVQHPQYAMKQFLEKCGTSRTAVQLWQNAPLPDTPRDLLLREVMRPAAVTDAWRDLKPGQLPRAALNVIERLTLTHTQEEAGAIALRLRAHLDTPNKTALFVTADRDLADRVSALLARWSIIADDSAGQALVTMPVGVYLLLALDAALALGDCTTEAVALLSLLKHPLTACGMEPAACRLLARQIERQTWREEKMPSAQQIGFVTEKLCALLSDRPRTLVEWLTLHRRTAEQLADTPDISGAERLWQGDDGLTAADWFATATEAATGYPPMTLQAYRSLCERFLRETSCRARFGQHPRLAILGPLEARLAHADLMILGGLNEGVWPPAPSVDPWMSRPMKQQFGLLSPELRVGLSAHDFVQLASQGQVLLTRAKRVGSAPAVPSRFWLQMDAVFQAA